MDVSVSGSKSLLVFATDWEGHPLSEAHQLPLRFGCQSVRLVRKHGEDHEGTGLPDRKRHFNKVSNDPEFPHSATCCGLFTDPVWSLHFSVSFSYYASQKKTLEINPKHPLIKQMLKRVNVSHFTRLLHWGHIMYFCCINCLWCISSEHNMGQ